MSCIQLKARFVVGYEEGHHVFYEQGVVVYKDDRIVFVGKTYQGSVDETRVYPTSIISPGFIDLDADVDSDHALQDIAICRDEKNAFSLQKDADFRDAFKDKDYEKRHRFSMLHLLKNGITTIMPIAGETFYPWSMNLHEVGIMERVARECGIRAYLGPSFKSRRLPNEEIDEKKERQSYRDALLYCEQHRDSQDRIQAFMNPCQLHITRLTLLKEAALYAQNYHIPYRLHACEGIREWKYTMANFQKTSIHVFEDEGMLFDRFIIPHCILATPEELSILKERKVSVISTPFADVNVATALFSFEKYKAYGVNMTMGTDTHPGDMLRNLRMAWDLDRLCHRRKFFSTYHENGTQEELLPNEPEYSPCDADTYFNAATLGGATALGRDDLGRLCNGAKADIIIIELADMHIGPIDDPIRTLLNSATGKHISHVIVDGKDIVSDYKLVDYDENDILLQAQDAYNHYKQCYEKYDIDHKTYEQMFPSVYPVK